MQWLEYGTGIVVGSFVVVLFGHNWFRIRTNLKNKRMELDALAEYRQEKKDDHRNGDGKVA